MLLRGKGVVIDDNNATVNKCDLSIAQFNKAIFEKHELTISSFK